ncbi:MULTISPECIES: ABC transporter substrate-binding protein [Micrococcaceae]|uniref:ABC transporter substrate-binding protein n=2 Tax=Micrococcales TaxID=85006 RepID=UPI000CFB46A4|nr:MULTISPECIES: ABC transporter substrate-binding protein [unclassified Arthrobacter]PRB74652.1 thiamine biosynthesis protein [Arthrobacter sp. MYb214]TDU24595.1 NitT/TauT family transport system substrate-binding protein [Arthrobacter sp. JUb115]
MKKRWSTLLAGAAVLSLGLVGCGGGSLSGSTESEGSTSAAAEDGSLTKITVGILPIAPSVAVQQGIDAGTFEKHGLDVELSTSNAGAAMLPAVSTGELAIAVGNPLSVMTAADKGLDMKIVTGYSASKADGEDVNGVVVRKDSGIGGWEDLAGKTTSVNALRTQGDLTIMESAEMAGANPKDLKFSEMPFPDMEAQLDRGNVDAVWLPEPFLSRALGDKDNELLGYPNQEAIPGLPTMVTFTSGQFAEENPEVISKWKAAMAEVLPASDSDPDAARAMLPDFINMDAKVAEGLLMETWEAETPIEELAKLGDLAAKFEFLEKAPDMNNLIAK